MYGHIWYTCIPSKFYHFNFAHYTICGCEETSHVTYGMVAYRRLIYLIWRLICYILSYQEMGYCTGSTCQDPAEVFDDKWKVLGSLTWCYTGRFLRTVPPIASAHPFCASRETLPRARPHVSPDAYSMLTSICKKNTPQRAVCWPFYPNSASFIPFLFSKQHQPYW